MKTGAVNQARKWMPLVFCAVAVAAATAAAAPSPATPGGEPQPEAKAPPEAPPIPADFDKQIAEARQAALTTTEAQNEGFPLLAIYGLCAQCRQPQRAVKEFRALIPTLDKTDPASGRTARVDIVASLINAGKLEDATREMESWKRAVPKIPDVEELLEDGNSFLAIGYERAGKWAEAAKLWEPMTSPQPFFYLPRAAHLADCLEHMNNAQRARAVISQMEEWSAHNPIDDAGWSHMAHAETVKARILVKEGKFADAAAICESVKTDPKYATQAVSPNAEPQPEPIPILIVAMRPDSSPWIEEAKKMLSAMSKEKGVSKVEVEEKPGVSPATVKAPVEVSAAEPVAALGAALVARAQVGKVEITFSKAPVEQKFVVTNSVRIRWIVTGVLASFGNGPARYKSAPNADIALFLGDTVVRIPVVILSEDGRLMSIGKNGAEPNKELAGVIKVLWGNARLSTLRNPGADKGTPFDAKVPLSADEGDRLAAAEANSMAADAFEASLPLEEAKLTHYLADCLASTGAGDRADGAEPAGQRTRGLLAGRYTAWALALAELGRCEEALRVADALGVIFSHDDVVMRSGETWKEGIKTQKITLLAEIYKKNGKYKEAIAQLELFIQHLLNTQAPADDKGSLNYEIYLREPQQIAQCYEADWNYAEAIRVYKEILDAFNDGGEREKSVRAAHMGQQYDFMMAEVKNALAKLETERR